MKTQDYVSTTLHTHIEDISAIGNELSDEHLRLVPGGAGKQCTYDKTWVSCCAYKRDCNVD